MTQYKTLSVIIPAYNEEATIADVIERVKKVPLADLKKEIIVVNDGSRDKTGDVLKQIDGIRYYIHEVNKGKGSAIKTGIQHASGDILLIQDGDLEYNPEDYGTLLQPILANEVQFVIGSRFLHHGPRFFTKNGDPFISHYIGNRLIIWMTNMLYNQSITDYEGCYKAFTRSIANSISVKSNGFAFDNELMCKSIRRGFKITEVPIRYSPRLYSQGKKIRWTDGVIILWTILKWRFLPV